MHLSVDFVILALVFHAQPMKNHACMQKENTVPPNTYTPPQKTTPKTTPKKNPKTTPKTTNTQTTHDPKFDPWAGIGPFLKKHMIRAGVKPKVKLFHKPKKPQEPLALS